LDARDRKGESEMTTPYLGIALRSAFESLSRLTLGVALVTTTVSCAPDSVRSMQATGFNAYLKQIGEVCRPLLIGNQDIGQMIQLNDMGNNDYNYFLDVTSKLYYNRLTPASYRQAVVGFFGAGTPNDQSFNCIFRNLPPDRPNAPVGTY
jgi:hypothetical protein